MKTSEACLYFPLIFLTAAAFRDAASAKIPNSLLLWAVFPGGLMLGPPFLRRLLLTVLLFYPLFRLGLTGGGDVKLMAAVAAWSGTDRFLYFLLFSFLCASVPASVLLFRKKHARIPMAPFFLCGWILVLAAEGAAPCGAIPYIFLPGGKLT